MDDDILSMLGLFRLFHVSICSRIHDQESQCDIPTSDGEVSRRIGESPLEGFEPFFTSNPSEYLLIGRCHAFSSTMER